MLWEVKVIFKIARLVIKRYFSSNSVLSVSPKSLLKRNLQHIYQSSKLSYQADQAITKSYENLSDLPGVKGSL